MTSRWHREFCTIHLFYGEETVQIRRRENALVRQCGDWFSLMKQADGALVEIRLVGLAVPRGTDQSSLPAVDKQSRKQQVGR